MKIKFCGAAREVTGSSHLITLDDGYQILLDCGLYQGHSNTWEDNNKWYFSPNKVDCVILSHAHIDHCGRLPQLVKSGFKGNIYATHATKNLCGIMLLDSAKIQERDAEWHNKKVRKKKKKARKQKFRNPIYTSKHVTPTMKLFVGYSYERWHYIREGVEILFRDAGHILGSASVTLRITENGKTTMIGFTGDIGRPERPILRDPAKMPSVDYLISESTYGNRLHDMLPEQSDKLYNCIKHTCIDKKGKLIIPAFSLGRTQEIVYMLDKMESSGRLPKIPIYVDSPLAVNATQIFGLHPECFDDNLNEYMLTDSNPFGFNSLHYVRSVEVSKGLNTSKKPCVIISASGMMNAGRIRHHLYNNLENEKNTILVVGYCSPHTTGGLLRGGATELKIFGDTLMVKAEVQIMDAFSAHADRNEMYKFIKHQRKNAKSLFLVHGEHETQKEYKGFLLQKGFKKVEIPKQGQEIVLS